MVTNLVNLFSQVFAPLQMQRAATTTLPTITPKTVMSSNPFANPFMSSGSSRNGFYGKNAPVRGGYFAGYYNGQPNIVGKRLFIEV